MSSVYLRGGGSSTRNPDLPRFVWGEGLKGRWEALGGEIYLTHTAHPRFICTIAKAPAHELLAGHGASNRARWCRDTQVWKCLDFDASRFKYLDQVPESFNPHSIMVAAALNYRLWRQASEVTKQAYVELSRSPTIH